MYLFFLQLALATLQASPFVLMGFDVHCSCYGHMARYSGMNLSRSYGRKPADIFLSFW